MRVCAEMQRRSKTYPSDKADTLEQRELLASCCRMLGSSYGNKDEVMKGASCLATACTKPDIPDWQSDDVKGARTVFWHFNDTPELESCLPWNRRALSSPQTQPWGHAGSARLSRGLSRRSQPPWLLCRVHFAAASSPPDNPHASSA